MPPTGQRAWAAVRESRGDDGKMDGMTRPGDDDEQGRRVAVGVPVSTRRTWGPGLVVDPGLRTSGVIVADHGDVIGGGHAYGREWALPRRWAIALDDGSLVFRNDDELALD